jgi:hypothetical protein
VIDGPLDAGDDPGGAAGPVVVEDLDAYERGARRNAFGVRIALPVAGDRSCNVRAVVVVVEGRWRRAVVRVEFV